MAVPENGFQFGPPSQNASARQDGYGDALGSQRFAIAVPYNRSVQVAPQGARHVTIENKSTWPISISSAAELATGGSVSQSTANADGSSLPPGYTAYVRLVDAPLFAFCMQEGATVHVAYEYP